LLGHVLKLLTDPQTRQDIGTGVDILVRVIGAVDPVRLMESATRTRGSISMRTSWRHTIPECVRSVAFTIPRFRSFAAKHV